MASGRTETATRRERVEEKERAILAAARAVFVKNGFEGARVAEIARRAGVAEGTIYLYYRTKNDLLQAVVLQFWEAITEGAQKAVNADADTFEQFRALAMHHLGVMSREREFLELEVILRHSGMEPIASERTKLKRYVAVFDAVFRRGQDRGDLVTEAEIWMARDLFYGGLEYSARTMALRGLRRQAGVVENLVATLRARYGKPAAGDKADATVADRLEAAVTRLERLGRSSANR